MKFVVFGWDSIDSGRVYNSHNGGNKHNEEGELRDVLQPTRSWMIRNDAILCNTSITKNVLPTNTLSFYYRWNQSHSFFNAFILSILQKISLPLDECGVYAGDSFVLLHRQGGSSSFSFRPFHEYELMKDPYYQIRELPFSHSVASVSCGSDHALVLTEDHLVFAVGNGKFGELGLGENVLETNQQLLQVSLPVNETPFFIATGPNHSAIITSPFGYLYTFGCGSYFRLGHSNDDHAYYPMRVEALVGVGELNDQAVPTGIKVVGCGNWHTVAVASGSNDVYGMGWNKFGQLGTLSKHEKDFRERIIDQPERIAVLDDEELLGDFGCSANRITAICCGSKFTCLLTQSHRVIIMGQLGSGPIRGIDPEHCRSAVGIVSSASDEYKLVATAAGFFSQITPREIPLHELLADESPASYSNRRKRSFQELRDEIFEIQMVANRSYLALVRI